MELYDKLFNKNKTKKVNKPSIIVNNNIDKKNNFNLSNIINNKFDLKNKLLNHINGSKSLTNLSNANREDIKDIKNSNSNLNSSLLKKQNNTKLMNNYQEKKVINNVNNNNNNNNNCKTNKNVPNIFTKEEDILIRKIEQAKDINERYNLIDNNKTLYQNILFKENQLLKKNIENNVKMNSNIKTDKKLVNRDKAADNIVLKHVDKNIKDLNSKLNESNNKYNKLKCQDINNKVNARSISDLRYKNSNPKFKTQLSKSELEIRKKVEMDLYSLNNIQKRNNQSDNKFNVNNKTEFINKVKDTNVNNKINNTINKKNINNLNLIKSYDQKINELEIKKKELEIERLNKQVSELQKLNNKNNTEHKTNKSTILNENNNNAVKLKDKLNSILKNKNGLNSKTVNDRKIIINETKSLPVKYVDKINIEYKKDINDNNRIKPLSKQFNLYKTNNNSKKLKHKDDYYDDYENDSFLVDDEIDDPYTNAELGKLRRMYNKGYYNDDGSSDIEEANAYDIEKEEMISRRIGLEEDYKEHLKDQALKKKRYK